MPFAKSLADTPEFTISGLSERSILFFCLDRLSMLTPCCSSEPVSWMMQHRTHWPTLKRVERSGKAPSSSSSSAWATVSTAFVIESEISVIATEPTSWCGRETTKLRSLILEMQPNMVIPTFKRWVSGNGFLLVLSFPGSIQIPLFSPWTTMTQFWPSLSHCFEE